MFRVKVPVNNLFKHSSIHVKWHQHKNAFSFFVLTVEISILEFEFSGDRLHVNF